MQEADCSAHRQTDAQTHQPAHATPGVWIHRGKVVAFNDIRGGHGTDCEDRTDREINTGGQNDKGHPDRHDPVDRHFGENVENIAF
ncbi:hypothetical protein D3C81_1822790 [compost metagenome]